MASSSSEIQTRLLWTHELTTDLIDIYRKYPVLYKTKNSNYRDKVIRREALKAIKNEMFQRKGCEISIEDIKKKIHGLRTQYASQLARINRQHVVGVKPRRFYKPTLWCFEKLSFLRGAYGKESGANMAHVGSSQGTLSTLNDSSEATNSSEENPDDLHEAKDLGELNLMEYHESDNPELEVYYNEITVKEENVTPPSSSVSTPILSSTDIDTNDDLSVFVKLVELELRKINSSQLLRKAKRDILNIVMDAQERSDD